MKSLLIEQAREMILEDPWYVAALSNLSALIMQSMPDLNWAGFYLMRGGQLVVGPFQGKTACIHIAVGKGVCGTCVKEGRTILVPDVHAFPGHIACDSASRSEIVIPLCREGKTAGVLDIDSPLQGRFSEEDKDLLEGIVKVVEETVRWED